MNANLLERRLKMIKMKANSVSLTNIIKDLAKEYEVSQRTLYKDYENRSSWMRPILAMDNPENFWVDIWSKHKELERMARLDYMLSEAGSNARVGNLKILRDLNRDFIELIVTEDLLVRLKTLEKAKK